MPFPIVSGRRGFSLFPVRRTNDVNNFSIKWTLFVLVGKSKAKACYSRLGAENRLNDLIFGDLPGAVIWLSIVAWYRQSTESMVSLGNLEILKKSI
jgi:hypothetical protein